MSKKGSTGAKKSGNTKRISPSKNWCFTLNNWTHEELISIMNKIMVPTNRLIIGAEIGEKKTLHLQGYAYFGTKIRPSSLGLTKRIHWEKCKGTQEDNVLYCSKEHCVLALWNLKIPKPLKLLKSTEFYPWQRKVSYIMESDPDDRTVYWIWDAIGNTGKTWFAKWAVATLGAMYVKGCKKDILYAAAEGETDCYIIDLSRTVEDRVPYEAIEDLKNGIFFSGKYESKQIIRNCPHVFVFANFEPDLSKLSKDRWDVKEISKLSKDFDIDMWKWD